MEPIILIGAGGHCAAVIDVIESEGKFKIAGLVTKDQDKKTQFDYPVLGTDADLSELVQHYKYAHIAIGKINTTDLRQKIFVKLQKLGFKLPVIVSPAAYVAKTSKLGAGSIVMHQALINANAVVGDNCIINTKALVEHDAVIGSNVHIATRATVNGGVSIGDNSFIGSCAVTKQAIAIKPASFIKANSMVKENV